MKDRAGVLLKNQTSRGKQNPLSPALKQRHAKTRLQISHLLRNARLGNSEAIGRPAEASSFGDCEKITQGADNQELDSGERFCFHRQNLLRYFQNLWRRNDSRKTDLRRRAWRFACGRLQKECGLNCGLEQGPSWLHRVTLRSSDFRRLREGLFQGG